MFLKIAEKWLKNIVSDFSTDEFPWAVAIFIGKPGSSKSRCGGSIISTNYVITAEHCTKGENMKNIEVS